MVVGMEASTKVQQITVEEAFASQTLAFSRSRTRGWGVQCKVIRRNGVRCRKWAIKGAFVCYRHGGCFPAVKASAQARLRSLMPEATKQLGLLLESKDERIRLKAIRLVWDMAKLKGGLDPEPGARPQRALPSPSSIDIDELIESMLASKQLEPPVET